MRSGLDELLPRKRVFAELMAGWSSVTGPVARAAAGAQLGKHAAVYGYGQWTPAETTAGVGVRVTR